VHYAWDWWFDGTNISQGWPNTAQVDVPGGGFWPGKDLDDYYVWSNVNVQTLANADRWLRDGYGLVLDLAGAGGHAVTCWGLNHDPDDPNAYRGIWVTDSDDDRDSNTPPDRLRYYAVSFSNGYWYLDDFYGSDRWYVNWVYGLRAVPEPASAAGLLAASVCMLLGRRRRPARRPVRGAPSAGVTRARSPSA
jgi:hypothetical protein